MSAKGNMAIPLSGPGVAASLTSCPYVPSLMMKFCVSTGGSVLNCQHWTRWCVCSGMWKCPRMAHSAIWWLLIFWIHNNGYYFSGLVWSGWYRHWLVFESTWSRLGKSILIKLPFSSLLIVSYLFNLSFLAVMLSKSFWTLTNFLWFAAHINSCRRDSNTFSTASFAPFGQVNNKN
jgi:hypothetical protein